jgi:GTPase SAR1 family protein
MIQNEYFRNFSVVITGDTLVGKTDILNRLLGKGYKGLIEVGEYSEKRIIDTKTNGKLLISYSKCPSGESYEKYNENLYKFGEGFIIVFDITDKSTFDCIDKYVNLIKEKSDKFSLIALIRNKIDSLNKIKIMMRIYQFYIFFISFNKFSPQKLLEDKYIICPSI